MFTALFGRVVPERLFNEQSSELSTFCREILRSQSETEQYRLSSHFQKDTCQMITKTTTRSAWPWYIETIGERPSAHLKLRSQWINSCGIQSGSLRIHYSNSFQLISQIDLLDQNLAHQRSIGHYVHGTHGCLFTLNISNEKQASGNDQED